MRAKTQVEYLGFRGIAVLLAALPLPIAAGLMSGMWRAVGPALKRHARVLAHLEQALPEVADAERVRIARSMWGHLGRTYAEFFHAEAVEARFAFEPPDALERMRRGGPFVVCALHMGNWEAMAGLSAKFGRPLAGVYQPLTNPKADALLWAWRRPHYPLGLYPRSPATLRRLMRIAKRGGSIGFMADLRERNGRTAPFFGRPAKSNATPARIARACGLKLYAARVLRQPGERFTLRVEPVEIPHTHDRLADADQATARVQAWFEAFVREAPEQWMWAHRRWD